MADALKFRFGAEIEVLTGSKANEHMEWYLTANELSEELTSIQLKNHVNYDHNKAAEDYTEWSLQQEVTIPNQMMQNRWGLELVSPILDFQRPDIWHAHLGSVWWVLSEKFHTSTTDKCSTHVHISPTEGEWTHDQVRKIAKAAIYFERSIDTLLPSGRRANPWCRSNRWNTILKPQDMTTLFSWIDGTSSVQHIAFLMCAFSKDSEFGKSVGKTEDFMHNVFRWNFTPLKGGEKGTIEFRQPPGSATHHDSQLWVTFTAAFIQGAVQWADAINAKEAPTLDLLKRYLINGAVYSGVQDTSALADLFEGKRQLPPGEYNLGSIDEEELALMKRKATEMNVTVEKFKDLFGYK